MRQLIPTRAQWRSWSLPSKLGCIGTLLGVLSLVLSVLFYVWPAPWPAEKPRQSPRSNQSIALNGEKQAPESQKSKTAAAAESTQNTENEVVSFLAELPKGATITITVSGKSATDIRARITHTITRRTSLRVIESSEVEPETQYELPGYSTGSPRRHPAQAWKDSAQYALLYDPKTAVARLVSAETGEVVAIRQLRL